MFSRRHASNTAAKVFVRGLLLVAIGLLVLAPVGAAQAHCDSPKGPVATAARAALEEQDISLVLPYVPPEAEAELTAAFERRWPSAAWAGRRRRWQTTTSRKRPCGCTARVKGRLTPG